MNLRRKAAAAATLAACCVGTATAGPLVWVSVGEDAYRLLMRAYSRQGNRRQALVLGQTADDRQGMGLLQSGFADGHADAFFAEVEGEHRAHGLRRGRQRRKAG